MLVAAGASLLVNDGAGLSPRQLALMAEDMELAEYLESQEHFQVIDILLGVRNCRFIFMIIIS